MISELVDISMIVDTTSKNFLDDCNKNKMFYMKI